MRVLLAASSVAIVSVLHGCGDSGNTETTSRPVTDTTTTKSATHSGIPLYLVLRMDDIAAPEWMQDRMADTINWALKNKVKFNFGLIAGPDGELWPTNCLEDPREQFCSSPQVRAIYDAYIDGNVRGNPKSGGQELLELGCHSWAHGGWAEKFKTHMGWKEWMLDDMEKSTTILRKAFPNASMRTFTPPENLMEGEALKAAKAHGWDIITTQATAGCDQPVGTYMYGPCEDLGKYYCMPKDDIWITSDGFAQVDGVYSAPNGCASENYNTGKGISAADALGHENDCGCNDEVVCSVIASAEQNAKNSNGVRWAVMMTHPQDEFPGGQTWSEWLDDFYKLAQEQSKYDIQFIHFQDLVELKAEIQEVYVN